MGQKEFSVSLADFNQDQLNAIQESADDILLAVNAIKTTDVALLNTKIGTTADASTVLSVFGLLAKLVNGTLDIPSKPKTSGMYAALTPSTWYTVCDITGSGRLNTISYYSSLNFSTLASLIEVELTIDNNAPMGGQAAGSIADASAMQMRAMLLLTGSTQAGIYNAFIDFKTKLKIRFRNTHTSTSSMGLIADYALV